MTDEKRTRTIPSKRSIGKYPRIVDYPSYDASEEDNDPLTDDAASTISMPTRGTANPNPSRTVQSQSKHPIRPKHQLAAALLSDSDGVDSPTYDGDIESSATVGREDPPGGAHSENRRYSHHYSSSSVSTLNTPSLTIEQRELQPDTNQPVFIAKQQPDPVAVTEEPPVTEIAQAAFDPASLTARDIQEFVRKAIEGEEGRMYKINPPPSGRPIRIYADGVYDLFHFGHALQLRQAKLSFPSVYLLAGVNSDEDCHSRKAPTVMTHVERCEAVRHCRWVDEVLPDVPWVLDEAFIKRYSIDYVAHDEDPYVSGEHDDVYTFVKQLGRFVPTRRTPGVSTSELLERIVSGYRRHDFDDKLIKIGRAELTMDESNEGSTSRCSTS